MMFRPKASAAPPTAVERRIAAVRNKMIGTVLIILALGVWQRHFVLEGIAAHVEITLTILGTFAFSVSLAFVFVAKLKNEVVAYKALREMWDDIQHANRHAGEDLNWRLERCAVPAQVFQRPRLLGHAYELVTAELARTKKIRVSVETMNTLVHTVEQSINDEKSLITYLSGLLVFMGLIGTFIGLLHMVGSIGGIIGSLAGSASGADSSGAFGELLSALQEPLRGMASGFAASLFGLFSSLVVGLLGRFAGQAAGVLKSEFEAWLAGVVQIGEEEEESAARRGVPHGAVIEGQALGEPALLRMVGGILADYSRVAGHFNEVTRAVQGLQAAQNRQHESLETLVRQVARMELDAAAAAQERARHGAEQAGLLAAQLEGVGQTIARTLAADQHDLRAALDEMNRQHADSLRLLSTHQHQSIARLSETLDMVSADIARRAQTPPVAVESIASEAAVRALGGHEGRHSARLAALDDTLARLAAGQNTIARTLADLAEARAGEGSADAMTGGLAGGLERLNTTMDTALSAYSGLLHVALAALERADAKPAPRPDTEPSSAHRARL